MTSREKKEKVAPMEKLLTLEEVADYLRLSKDTVYRLANTGKLPASKVGNQWRFRKEDVDQWLERNKNVRRDETPDEE
ncbi:MAG: helix-turn-helix domain-containing protein [Bryobacteraceae bacterium]|jgi:excisionase family DNA binding protein|nr:helix-turn-helix domain-containing protein [Bryobacteraceae bacterium]